MAGVGRMKCMHARAQAQALSRARARTRARARYLEEHYDRLQDIGGARPEVFLIVSLREPERDVAAYVSRAAERHPREWLREAQARILSHATGAC